MKAVVVGATGLVGTLMCKLLEERNFPVSELLVSASERSIGKEIDFKGQKLKVQSVESALNEKPDLALFSAGSGSSLEWAPKFAEQGTVVIDNSSAWRMDPTKKLVVPEVNAHQISVADKIIANPNCSTIQMVVALAPLHRKYRIKRLVIATYQSFTGTGMKAVKQYELESKGFMPTSEEMAYPYPIFQNCLPHCDIFLENDYTKEEMKLVNETRKILGDNQIKITATAVRVPVDGGHSEAVNIEFANPYELDDVKSILNNEEGIRVMDDIRNNQYPMPLFAKDQDEVFVGRIRRDDSIENGLNLWVVSDNLRKGAATNAIQIAEFMISKNLL